MTTKIYMGFAALIFSHRETIGNGPGGCISASSLRLNVPHEAAHLSSCFAACRGVPTSAYLGKPSWGTALRAVTALLQVKYIPPTSAHACGCAPSFRAARFRKAAEQGGDPSACRNGAIARRDGALLAFTGPRMRERRGKRRMGFGDTSVPCVPFSRVTKPEGSPPCYDNLFWGRNPCRDEAEIQPPPLRRCKTNQVVRIKRDCLSGSLFGNPVCDFTQPPVSAGASSSRPSCGRQSRAGSR